MRRVPACTSLALLCAACAPTLVQMSLAPADSEVAAAMLATNGTSAIKGSALLRQRGGGVVTCAGNDVFLIPATPSTTSELRRVFGNDKGYVKRGGSSLGGGKLVDAPTPNRRGQCNAQGFFTFANLPAGKWYVMTSVIWSVPGDYGSEYQGGTLLGTAEVRDGQEIEIVLG